MLIWVSHLPANLAVGRATGHGMNAGELTANTQLDAWFMQDLNRDPRLLLKDVSHRMPCWQSGRNGGNRFLAAEFTFTIDGGMPS